MNVTEPIIDVKPISSSRTRVQVQDSKTAPGVGGARGNAYTGNAYGPGTIGGAYAARPSSSMFGGLSQIIVGSGLVIIGIPMLLLPGPGLISIAAGGFLISNGLRKLRL
ncbi:MAG: hypothetical protein IKF56_04190 [Eggerthellaceae bacterium]|nr:hypothetical protein [Eggerthellaceae bacterium]